MIEKRLLTDLEYTITSTTTIVLSNDIVFEHKNIGLIVVTADNEIVYNLLCEDLKCTVSSQTITLLDKNIELTDSLTIVLQFEEGSDAERLDDITLWNKRQEKLLYRIGEGIEESNRWLKKIYNPE